MVANQPQPSAFRRIGMVLYEPRLRTTVEHDNSSRRAGPYYLYPPTAVVLAQHVYPPNRVQPH
jgi:hypothetical protein